MFQVIQEMLSGGVRGTEYEGILYLFYFIFM